MFSSYDFVIVSNTRDRGAAADAVRLKAFEEVIEALKQNGPSTSATSAKQKQANLL